MISYRKLRDFEEEIKLLHTVDELEFVMETLCYLQTVVDIKLSAMFNQSEPDYDED
jgi:hypothetical protein